MQIAQDISLRMYVKKCRRSGLRRGFLACIIREIAKSRCVSYFSTVPYRIRRKSICTSFLPFGRGYSFRETLVTDFGQNLSQFMVINPGSEHGLVHQTSEDKVNRRQIRRLY